MSPTRIGGSIYRRGQVYWIKYYRQGRPMRESAHTTSREVAALLLKKRLGAIAEGRQVSPNADRVKLAELLQDWITSMKIAGRRSIDQAKTRSATLVEFFGGRRAHAISAADVRAFVLHRQEQGMKPGTINLELAALKRAYALGIAAEKIYRAPHIMLLPVSNVRPGFFERPMFDAVVAELREEVVRDIAIVAYWIGWRGDELKKLECRQVDVELQALRIERGRTKGKEPRIVYLPPEAWAAVAKWYARRRVGSRISRHLFHRHGKPIRTFTKAWRNACVRAGHPGMIFHDLRRTAVRNMVRAGIREGVAMAITGHRTRAIFDRYNIIAEDDLRQAASLMGGEAKAKRDEVGHNGGHNGPFTKERR